MKLKSFIKTYWPILTLAAFALGIAHVLNFLIPEGNTNERWWLWRDIFYKLEIAYAFWVVRIFVQRHNPGDKWLLVWLTVMIGLFCETASQVYEGINRYHWRDLVIGTITFIIARRKYVS